MGGDGVYCRITSTKETILDRIEMKMLSNLLARIRMRCSGDKCYGIAVSLLIIVLMVGAVVQVLLSLQWLIEWDTALMHYMAYLVCDVGYVPYEEMSAGMYGGLLFHMAIVSLFGYGDFAVRIIDIVFVLSLGVVSYRNMRVYGKAPAIVGPLLFTLLYLTHGPWMTLERDVVLLLPLVISISIHDLMIRNNLLSSKYGLFLGALFAIVFSLKPHAVLYAPFIILVNWKWWKGWLGCRKILTRFFSAAIVGFIVITILELYFVFQRGGLRAFYEFMVNYMPLYNEIGGDYNVRTGLDRWYYILMNTIKFNKAHALLFAMLGVVALYLPRVGDEEAKRKIYLYLVLFSVSIAYVAVAGKFGISLDNLSVSHFVNITTHPNSIIL